MSETAAVPSRARFQVVELDDRGRERKAHQEPCGRMQAGFRRSTYRDVYPSRRFAIKDLVTGEMEE